MEGFFFILNIRRAGQRGHICSLLRADDKVDLCSILRSDLLKPRALQKKKKGHHGIDYAIAE